MRFTTGFRMGRLGEKSPQTIRSPCILRGDVRTGGRRAAGPPSRMRLPQKKMARALTELEIVGETMAGLATDDVAVDHGPD
jgi:hypothetical protein